MQINSASSSKLALIIFFIHPFIAFIIALRDLKNKHAQLVVLLFFTLFGYTFIAENESADSYHYVYDFNTHVNSPNSSFIGEVKEYLTFESDIKDIYVLSSYFLISTFTHNYHFLMALWAFVFSVFFLKAFKFFAMRPEYKSSVYTLLLVFLFIFSNNIFNINGVRFWTGAWLIVYIIFEVVVNKKNKFILLSFFAPLIHVSYAIFPILLICFLFLRKQETLLIFLFFLSFFFGEISLQLTQNFQEMLPKAIQNMIWSYTEGQYIEDRVYFYENEPLYARIFRSLPRLLINFSVIILILRRKYIRTNIEAYPLFKFLMLWLILSNFLMAIPSFGSRLIVIAFPVFAYLLLILYSKIKILKKVILIIPIAFSYIILEWLRNMITVTDPYLILSFFPHILIKNFFI